MFESTSHFFGDRACGLFERGNAARVTIAVGRFRVSAALEFGLYGALELGRVPERSQVVGDTSDWVGRRDEVVRRKWGLDVRVRQESVFTSESAH